MSSGDEFCLPRRPRRPGTEPEPRRRAPSNGRYRVFSTKPVSAGTCQIIETSTDRLIVAKRIEGQTRFGLFFGLEDLWALELGLARAATRESLKCCGSIPLKTGQWLDVGGGDGEVHIRIRDARTHARLAGPELDALRCAIEDLKTRGNPAALKGSDE